jgi:hypothetical protein
MVVHRWFHRRSGRARGQVDPFPLLALKVFANLQLVVFSRILFRATSIENAGDVTDRILSGTTSLAQVSLSVWLVLILGFVAHYLPKSWYGSVERTFVWLPAPAQGFALALVWVGLSFVATTQVVPYIYFQF